MTVSEQEVNRVAELANLELTVGERTAMVRDLNSLLDHFAQLNELDTTDVPPMAQVHTTGPQQGPELRPDLVTPSLDRAQVLRSAPDTDQVFFKVPKVIER